MTFFFGEFFLAKVFEKKHIKFDAKNLEKKLLSKHTVIT